MVTVPCRTGDVRGWGIYPDVADRLSMCSGVMGWKADCAFSGLNHTVVAVADVCFEIRG